MFGTWCSLKKAEMCMYSTPLFTYMCIAIHVVLYCARNTCNLRACVPLVCLLCAFVDIELVRLCVLSRFGPWIHDELNPGASLQRAHRQYNKRSMPALGSRLICMWMMLLALQENTVGRNGMIAADYYTKRLGIVCTLDSNPGFKPAASALHRH